MSVVGTKKTIASIVIAGAGLTGAGVAFAANSASAADENPGCRAGSVNSETIVGEIFVANAKNPKSTLDQTMQRNLDVAYNSKANACSRPTGHHFSVVFVKHDSTLRVTGDIVDTRGVYMNNTRYDMYFLNNGAIHGAKAAEKLNTWGAQGDLHRADDDTVNITGSTID